MSDNLYKISMELQAINDELIKADGELDTELEARLDTANIAIRAKIDGICRWIMNLDSNSDAIQAEIERLKEKQAMADKLADRLKEYVKQCMIISDTKKIDGPLFCISVASNPASVEITDNDAIPACYKTIRQDVVIDKRLLLTDLKSGKEVAGARLITDKTNLRIR